MQLYIRVDFQAIVTIFFSLIFCEKRKVTISGCNMRVKNAAEHIQNIRLHKIFLFALTLFHNVLSEYMMTSWCERYVPYIFITAYVSHLTYGI